MKRDTSLFIEDILESIKNIESFTKGITEKELSKNIEKQSAIIRQIEIIGEAAKNIPLSIRKKYPDIPWKDIVGMRDVISHGYFKVDLFIVWKVIKEDLPDLKEKIEEVKENLKRESTNKKTNKN